MKKQVVAVICVVLAVWFFVMGFELGIYKERKDNAAATPTVPAISTTTPTTAPSTEPPVTAPVTTEPVTVTAAMQLYERGLFQLDDELSRYLPEFAGMRVIRKNDDGSVDIVPAREPIRISHIFEMTAGFDYDKDSPLTRTFFSTVQNKLHWAITGKTAAEIIYESADATKPHMGLTTWKHSPDGKVLKSDVTIAKNYLSEKNINALNRLVTAYIDLAEDRAEREIPTTMNDWCSILDDFLNLAQRPVLENAGSVTALEAKIKAESEYEVFRKTQDQTYVSDFDKEIKRLKG